MTKQRQSTGKWLRRFGLIAWAGMFLSNLGRVMSDESTAVRVISAVMMVGCVALFIYWWRMPVADDARLKSPGVKR